MGGANNESANRRKGHLFHSHQVARQNSFDGGTFTHSVTDGETLGMHLERYKCMLFWCPWLERKQAGASEFTDSKIKMNCKTRALVVQRRSRADRFKEIYSIAREDPLGSGGFGTVYRGVRNEDNLPVAAKLVKKRNVAKYIRVSGRKVPFEICVHHQLSHIPGVIKLLGWYELNHSFMFVMERLQPSRDLFSFITEKTRLKGEMAKKIFSQITEAVRHLHEFGVVHRDIKDENVVINDETLQVKLVDFGAAAFAREAHFEDYAGTRVYSPPEWLRDEHYDGKQADVWALGILLYNMVTGNVPFEFNEEIMKAKVIFRVDVPSDVQDLIRKCLSIEPSKRPTAKEMLEHVWLSQPINKEQSEAKQGQTEVKQEQSEIKHEQSDVKQEQSDVKQEQSDVKQEQSEEQSDVKQEQSEEQSDVKQEQSDVKQEQSEEQSDVKQEQSDVKQEQSGKDK